MAKVIDRKNYLMVLNWSNYINKKTKLICKCDVCGETTLRSLKSIDRSNGICRCENCIKNLRLSNMCETYKNNIDTIVKKIKRTKKEKYNNEKYNNVDKWKTTNLSKYGVEFPLQSDEIKNKWKENFEMNHGVRHPMQIKEIKHKRDNTNLRNHGVKYSSQINRTPEQIQITSTKEAFEVYIQDLEKEKRLTIAEIGKFLGLKDESYIRSLFIKWNFD
jgi:hypothetical protein